MLEEAGIWSQIKRLAGSNTGAIMAALLGVGYKSHDIQQFFSKSVQSIFEGIFCFFIKLKWPKNFYVGSTWEFSWTMWFYFGRGTWRTQDLFTIELNIFKYEYLDMLQTIRMLMNRWRGWEEFKKLNYNCYKLILNIFQAYLALLLFNMLSFRSLASKMKFVL